MKKNPLVLAIAILLFVGWVAYLGVTALHNKQPTVVSRAQLAVSEYDVEADLAVEPGGLPTKINVRSVLWAANANKPSGEITVANLPSAQGYVGPGTYILPLIRRGQDYEVVEVPSNLDPGSPVRSPVPQFRIYPKTDEVMRQWSQIH